MAVLKGRKEGLKGPSFRGAIYIYARNGTLVVAKWPRHKKRKRTLAELKRERDFRGANWQTKYNDAKGQAWANEATRGTPIYPRDIQIMCMYGRIASITLANGTRLYPMAARRDVSGSLDILGQTPGDVLTRSGDLWGPASGGVAGALLTHQGPGMPAAWVPAAVHTVHATRVERTSNINLSGPAANAVSWQVARFDTHGSWNAGQPTRLTVPAGHTHARFTAGYDSGTNTTGRLLWYLRHMSGAGYGGCNLVPNTIPANSFSSGIVGVTPGDYFEMIYDPPALNRLNASPGTFFSAEWFD